MSASHFNLQLGLTDLRPGCFLLELDTTSPLKAIYIQSTIYNLTETSWQTLFMAIWVTFSFFIPPISGFTLRTFLFSFSFYLTHLTSWRASGWQGQRQHGWEGWSLSLEKLGSFSRNSRWPNVCTRGMTERERRWQAANISSTCCAV